MKFNIQIILFKLVITYYFGTVCKILVNLVYTDLVYTVCYYLHCVSVFDVLSKLYM